MTMNEMLQENKSLATERREEVSLPPVEGLDVKPIEILRFGTPGARPKVYMHATLHADELPGMLVLWKLARELRALDERGEILGEIVLVPISNPIGLAQVEGGYLIGRVERSTGRNFNRGFCDLAALAKEHLKEPLGDDSDANLAALRQAMREGTAALQPTDAFGAMQKVLMHEACDADIVLDLHADNEAMLHLYVGETNWPDGQDLAAELDARAVLLTDESGGEPFDESNGHAWARLREAFSNNPIPQGCLSATVELRSNNHVTERDSDRDARALLRFLMRRGVVEGNAGGLPRLLCEAHPLRAMQQVKAPAEGLIVYRAALGDTLRVGDVIAEIAPRDGGDPIPVEATTDGVLFARHDQTWAWEGKVIGKVAGRDIMPERTGPLLTP